MNPDEAVRARVESLLGIDSYGAQVVPTVATPGATAIGAHQSYAYEWPDSSVLASVYVYDSYADATEAEQQLKAASDSTRQTAGTVNGGLLLWVTAPVDSSESSTLLSQLVSSFAGQE